MNRKLLQPLLACAVLAAMAVTHAAEMPIAVPAEGEPFRGQFIGSDAAWNLRFADDGERREIPAADLVTWGAFVEPTRGIRILLADGGTIVADSVQLEKEQIVGTSPTFGNFSLPIELAAGIIFRPPPDAPGGDKLSARLLDFARRGDRLLLDNGDELSGTITAIKDKQILLETDADPFEVRFDTLAAIMFDPTLIDQPRAGGLRAMVGFREGDRVTAIEMTTESDTTELKLAGGVILSAPTASITALQVLGGRVVYLSDLKPAGYRHIPFLQLTWPFRADRSVLGSRLRAAGRGYLKGLGMHSPSRLTYSLDQPYARFDAQVAIDDEAEGAGSVVFRVFVDDGSGNWHERATSGIVRGGQPPVPISVDLEGIKRISLLVDYADRGDELDHADWLDARLVR